MVSFQLKTADPDHQRPTHLNGIHGNVASEAVQCVADSSNSPPPRRWLHQPTRAWACYCQEVCCRLLSPRVFLRDYPRVQAHVQALEAQVSIPQSTPPLPLPLHSAVQVSGGVIRCVFRTRAQVLPAGFQSVQSACRRPFQHFQRTAL